MQTNIRVEVEELSPVKKKLAVSVSAEDVKKEINAAYQSIRSTASIAGFRKGAVPLNILKARFSSHVQEDVTKKLVESTYPRALHEKNLSPVEVPKFDLGNRMAEEGKDFSYTLTVEVNPHVEVDGYRGMTLKQEETVVTDQDIEAGVKNLCEAAAQFKDVERPAKQGDLVVVDFEAFLDGNPIKNGKATDHPAIIGERTLLPGFDEALTGAVKGENREADIKFPENYSEANLGGKTGRFKLHIKAVKEKTVPELNEEFAKDVGCASLEALRERVRSEIEKHKKHEAKEKLKNSILDSLLEKHSFEVPEALANRYMALILNRVIDNMRSGIYAPGDKGLTPDQLKEKYLPMAMRSVKEDIILDAVAAKEKLEVTEEEVNEAIRNLAASRQVSFETLMARVEREGALEVVKDGLKHEKVFDIIIGASKPA